MERKLGIIHAEMVRDNIYVPKHIGEEPKALPPLEMNTYEVIDHIKSKGVYNLWLAVKTNCRIII